jgi:dTDP-glucose 4,6-dehydratase/UDP-glucose 4-epimerase
MKILIIGSEGFIGSHCVSHFLQNGSEVTGVDLVPTPKGLGYAYIQHTTGTGYDTLFAKEQFDACINASGNGSVPLSIKDPLFDFMANCSETISLLEAIKTQNQDCKLIHFSSAAVYGSPQYLPINEKTTLLPLSPYGWHKLMSEQLCNEYSNLYGLSITIVRPFSVYGPGLRKQLLWDIFQRSTESDDIELWGTGNESRDFIYITDLLKALVIIFIKAPMKAEVYNLASGVETTIQSVATELCFLLKQNLEIRFNGVVRRGDPLNWKADISKLKELGFEPEVSLKDGVKRYVEWVSRSV